MVNPKTYQCNLCGQQFIHPQLLGEQLIFGFYITIEGERILSSNIEDKEAHLCLECCAAAAQRLSEEV